MPILRLRKHQANFSDEDILINPADFNGLKLNDVVELKPPKGGNNSNRILLQVRKWPEQNQSYPNCVSIKDSVVNTHLQLYADVIVNIVDKRDVVVDSIEIYFSNAYLARSYMWGLRTHLTNRCVYQRQKLDYLHIRSQICEIWTQGSKVTSGYVDDDTKIVFRSASSLVYLFIQMSSEMWDYDINGDLYCEKAINGFLTELFDTWRRNDCSHDITIVLFSRTFYDAESLEEFPQEMRECLQVDYKNRYYEDCYRVAFQNDRFDLHDWNAKLTALKSLFNQYQKEVIDRHQEKYKTKIPRAYNSSASQGNFLEVLNMSLNVFEKHYFDRSFDRTGQLSVVVSPGVGVFEVDFEMTNLTKQRIIDNGIGSDLVCLGEQPLHTVPLLKFNSKSSQFDDKLTTCDVYNMPHWINLSFYSSPNQVYYSNFVPRIKLPTLSMAKLKSDSSKATLINEAPATTTRMVARTRADSNNLEDQQQNQRNLDYNKLTTDRSAHLSTSSSNNKTGLAAPSQPTRPTRNNAPSQQQQQQYSTTNHHHHHQLMPDLVDYDDFDAQVFKPNSMVTYNYCQQHSSRVLSDMNPNVDFLSDCDNVDNGHCDDDDDDDDGGHFLGDRNAGRSKSASIQRRSSDVKNYQEYSRNMKRQMTENLPISQTRTTPQVHQTSTFTRMSLVDSYLSDIKVRPESADDLSVRGYNVQSSRINRSAARPKALINPFDPSHMTIKLTPNRRRWTHVFPQGPTGTFIQQHLHQPKPQQQKSASPYLADVSPPPILENEQFVQQNPTKSSTTSTSPLLIRETISSRYQQQRQRINLDKSLIASTYVKNGGHTTSHTGQLSPHSHHHNQAGGGSSNSKSALVSNDTIRFAWCASGEQEWTPALTTGVDWKSLTMPACLPLTTDFFPSKTSLQNDYVIGEYTIDSSCIHPRYTLLEVYRELVCQRLQKGFQIILLPRQSTPSSSSSVAKVGSGGTKNISSGSSGGGSHHHHHHHHHHSTQTGGSHQQHHHQSHQAAVAGKPHHHSSSTGRSGSNRHSSSSSSRGMPGSQSSALHSSNHHHHQSSSSSLATARVASTSPTNDNTTEVERERTEYTMSIGRIFHKLTLNGNTITVTQYRPRHPYPTIKIDYCYRFRALFHETYGQSWVHFKSEKLENYSWNYLDNYICARGESFELRSSLKFWRFRILILPSRLCLRKLPHASGGGGNGNNKQESAECSTSGQQTASTRHDIHYLDYSDEERDSLMESFMKLLEIINKTRRASSSRLPSVGSASLSSSSSTRGSTNSSSSTANSGSSSNGNNSNAQQQQQQQSVLQTSPTRLRVQISTNRIDQQQQQQNANEDTAVTPHTPPSELHFESINMDIDSALRDAKRSEWVHVQYHCFYDIDQAFELVIKWMVASGAGIAEMVQSWSRKVGTNSSVHVVPIPWEPFAMPHSGKADPLRCPIGIRLSLNCLPGGNSLDDKQVLDLQEKILRRYGFITFHDLISTDNIERQFVHTSGFAFVALPNLVSDTGGGAGEKQVAQQISGICPQPLIEPNSSSGIGAANLGQQQQQQKQPVLVAAQEQAEVGLTDCAVDVAAAAGDDDVGLLNKTTTTTTDSTTTTTKATSTPKPLISALKLVHQETISSPHEEYITRHIGGARQNKVNRLRGENEQIEFIWSWNYMLTKRWRSPSTQNESYAVSLMQDFKDFCQNGDNRLVEFFNEINAQL